MDVAGVALAVTSLGMEVYKTLRTFINDIKNADLDHLVLSERNDAFGMILNRLQTIVDDQLQDITEDDKRILADHVKRAENILASIHHDLLRYNFIRNQTPSQKLKNVLTSSKWALRKDDIEDLVRRLDSVKGDMDFFLNIVQGAQDNSARKRFEGMLSAQHTEMVESKHIQEEHYSATRSIQHEIRAHNFTQASQLIELKAGVESSTITIGAMGKENTQLILSKLEEVTGPLRQQQGIYATSERTFRAHWKRSSWRIESSDEVAATFFLPFPWLHSFEAAVGFSSRIWGLTVGLRPRRYVSFYEISVDGVNVIMALHVSDVKTLTRMLESGAITVHDCDLQYGTMLHWAAVRGHTEICTMLLSRGADPDRAENLRRRGFIPHEGSRDRFISAGDLLEGLMESPVDWDISYAHLAYFWLTSARPSTCAGTFGALYNWAAALIQAQPGRAYGHSETWDYFRCFCQLILCMDPDRVKLLEGSAGIVFQRAMPLSPAGLQDLPDPAQRIASMAEQATERYFKGRDLKGLPESQRVVQRERVRFASDLLYRKALDLYAGANDQVATIRDLRYLFGLAQHPWLCSRETYTRYVQAFGAAQIATDQFDGKPIVTDLFEAENIWVNEGRRTDIGELLFDPFDVLWLKVPSNAADRSEMACRWRILAENTAVRTFYGVLEHHASPPLFSHMYETYVSPYLPAQLLLCNFKKSSLDEHMSDFSGKGQKPGRLMTALIALSIAQCDLVAVLILLRHFRDDKEQLFGCFEQLEALENIRIKFFCAPYYMPSWTKASINYRPPGQRLYRIEAQCLWLIFSMLALPCRETVAEQALESASAIYGHALSLDLETVARHALLREKDRLPLALRLVESLHRLWPNLCPCSKFDIQRVNRYYSKHITLMRLRKLRGYWDPPRFLNKTAQSAKDVPGTRAPSDLECVNACNLAEYSTDDSLFTGYIDPTAVAVLIADADYEEEWDAVDIGRDDKKDDLCICSATPAGITWFSLPQHWSTSRLLFLSVAFNMGFILMVGLYMAEFSVSYGFTACGSGSCLFLIMLVSGSAWWLVF